MIRRVAYQLIPATRFNDVV